MQSGAAGPKPDIPEGEADGLESRRSLTVSDSGWPGGTTPGLPPHVLSRISRLLQAAQQGCFWLCYT